MKDLSISIMLVVFVLGCSEGTHAENDGQTPGNSKATVGQALSEYSAEVWADTPLSTIQSKVDAGGTILFHATNQDGSEGYYDLDSDGQIILGQTGNDVTLQGETDNEGNPLTLVVGGSATLYSDNPDVAVTISGFNFQYATYTPIWIRQSSACTIENNVITTIIPLVIDGCDTGPLAVAYAVHVGGTLEEGPKPPDGNGSELLAGIVNINNNYIDCGVYVQNGNQVPPGQGALTDPTPFFSFETDLNYRGISIQYCAAQATVSSNTVINSNRVCMHYRSIVGSVDVTDNYIAPGPYHSRHQGEGNSRTNGMFLLGSVLRGRTDNPVANPKYTVTRNEIVGDENAKVPHATRPILEPASQGIVMGFDPVNEGKDIYGNLVWTDNRTHIDIQNAEITHNYIHGYHRNGIMLWAVDRRKEENPPEPYFALVQDNYIANNKIEGHGFVGLVVLGSDNNLFHGNNLTNYTSEHWWSILRVNVIFGYWTEAPARNNVFVGNAVRYTEWPGYYYTGGPVTQPVSYGNEVTDGVLVWGAENAGQVDGGVGDLTSCVNKDGIWNEETEECEFDIP